MLKVNCVEHLNQVKEFASKRGILQQLQQMLDVLDTYCCEKTGEVAAKCSLYIHTIPHSFLFEMHRKSPKTLYESWFIGSLRYSAKNKSWTIKKYKDTTPHKG